MRSITCSKGELINVSEEAKAQYGVWSTEVHTSYGRTT
jgi:hypothetical protein